MKHFTNILKHGIQQKNSQKDFHRFITEQFHVCAQKLKDDTYPDIIIQEITNALKNLKTDKSTSADLISNEMLKNGGNMLLKPLQKLFNTI